LNKIIRDHPLFILNKSEIVYFYDNNSGVYKKSDKKPEDVIEELVVNTLPFYIKEIVGDVFFARRVKTVTREIIIQSYFDEDLLDFDVINVKNGILKIKDIKNKKWKLYPHDPLFKSIFQLNIDFKPFISPKKKILLNTLKYRLGEQTDHLLKLFAVALLGTPYKYKIMTFIVGPSGTGKSEVILRILEHIVGESYIAHANIHQLCINQKNFESGELQGALLNINGDIGEDLLEDPSEINRLTEKFINVNRKYGFKGSILNTASHFYACNRMPTIADTDRRDIMRRFYTIDIRNKPIPEKERNSEYFNTLIKNDPNELESLFCVILSTLCQVLNDGDLKLPSIDQRKKKYFQLAYPLFSFITSYITKFITSKTTKPSETPLITRDYFLEIYNKYRKKMNYEPYESSHKLTAENDSLKRDIKLYTKQKDYKRVYMGVEFNQDAINDFEIDLKKCIHKKLVYFPKKNDGSDLPDQDPLGQFLPEVKKEDIQPIISKIINIFEGNPGKFLFKNSIVSILELDYSKNSIEKAFTEMYAKQMFEKNTKGIKLKNSLK